MSLEEIFPRAETSRICKMIEQIITVRVEVYPACPRNETLEAFKEWIRELASRLTGNADGDGIISEDDWVILWQDFCTP